jgi:hypothetical protein
VNLLYPYQANTIKIDLPMPGLQFCKILSDNFIWKIQKMQPGYQAYINMQNAGFIYPSGVIFLSLACELIKNITGLKVCLINCTGAMYSYLERCDLFACLKDCCEIKNNDEYQTFGRSNNSVSLVELTKIQNENDSIDFVRKIIRILDTWFPSYRSGDLRGAVKGIVMEALNNSTGHASLKENNASCFGMLQKYIINNKVKVVIAIGDGGIGIPEHQRRKRGWEHRYDLGYIQDALNGITGRINTDKGGLGLKTIQSFCNEYNGEIHIRSGKGYLKLSSRDSKAYEYYYRFPGTQLTINLNI